MELLIGVGERMLQSHKVNHRRNTDTHTQLHKIRLLHNATRLTVNSIIIIIIIMKPLNSGRMEQVAALVSSLLHPVMSSREFTSCQAVFEVGSLWARSWPLVHVQREPFCSTLRYSILYHLEPDLSPNVIANSI